MPIIHSQYREGGVPRVDEVVCTRCGHCADICPAEVLELSDGRIAVREDSPFGCIACGHCMMVCPSGAIRVAGRGVSPEDLAAMPAAGERATAEALGALMLARRSVRHFAEEEVDPALLDRVVEMAATAPMGIPPWDIGCIVVRGRTRVQELAGQIVKGYEGLLKMFRPWVLTLLRPIMGGATSDMFRHFIRPLAATYVRHWREGRDAVFYDAPAVIVFHHSPYADVADAMIACTYAMLAAESLGLGTTMIGGAAPIMKRDKTLCARLGIPKGNAPAICLIVGRPAVPFGRAIRRRFSSVVTVS